MQRNILIVSLAGDHHTFAVSEALRLKGVEPKLWLTSDFPGRSRETLSFSQGCQSFRLKDPEQEMDFEGIETAWTRRIDLNPDLSRLHPADRAFSSTEARKFREGSLFGVLPTAFWVNPPQAAFMAENKLYQHSIAHQSGMRMPESIYTNDPEEIHKFARSHGGELIYKPIAGTGWSDGVTDWACHTVALSEDQLVEDYLLELTPGIYQERVAKDYEVRLTMVGRQPFAAKILSQETASGKVDWRRAYAELRMEPITLPAEIVEQSWNLMERLGLVFGCLDYIVTPGGEMVFLEINQMGQFLFIEDYTGLPILDAFCELLLQGDADFIWHASRAEVRFEDVREATSVATSKSLEVHSKPSEKIVQE